MSIIKGGKELECPKCRSIDIEAVPFFYQSLKSKNAGKKLFSDTPFLSDTEKLLPRQRERLLHRLTPPAEPKKTLPAKAIALMAFLISWLATSSIILARLGYKDYFLISLISSVLLTIPFYSILRLVIQDFRKDIARYRRLKAVWDKQYFCKNCQEVFTLKGQE